MLYLTGIIAILFLTFSVLLLIRNTNDFRFSKHTVSQLAVIQKTKNKYLIVLLFYSALRLIYFPLLFTRFSLWNNPLIVFSFIIAFCSFIIMAFVTLTIHEKIHTLSALISGIVTSALILLLGIQLLQRSFFLGIASIFLSLNMFCGSWYLMTKKGANTYFQLYYVINVIIWDSLMLPFLYGLL